MGMVSICIGYMPIRTCGPAMMCMKEKMTKSTLKRILSSEVVSILYVRVDILLTGGKHLHNSSISLRGFTYT
jgi:hypothetical protein